MTTTLADHTAVDVLQAEDWGEQLVLCSSPESGLRAIIAIDSTVLGPAVGGTRMRPYASEADAIRDARRLAQAMTVKAALAGLPVGGGKAVIIADPERDKTETLLRAYGRFVDTLGGRYVAAQDVGTGPADLDIVAGETRHVTGVSQRFGGGGDPSPYTALGVHRALTAAVAHRGRSLADSTVVVLGAGSVGAALVDLLVEAGAEVLVADRSDAQLAAVEARHPGVRRVSWETAHTEQCDVLAPCALGGVLNDASIRELRCAAVVGAANNQLETAADADRLARRGIVYVPDFLASAGGLIAGTTELLWPPFRHDHALSAVDEIHDRTLMVLRRAETDGAGTLDTAHAIARERIQAARSLPSLRSAAGRRA